jgi:hypothetical protein
MRDVAAGGRRPVGRGLLGDDGPVGIEADNVGIMRGQMRAQCRAGEQHRRAGIASMNASRSGG